MQKDKINFTKNQALCVETLKKPLTILAAAGSGKTLVLIQRIKNILLTGEASLADIVAITFTEKAAGELIHRLTKELPTEILSQIDQATITTIHGFCTKILKEEGTVIGINPDFTILEEHASRILNHRIISDSVRSLLKEGDPDIERIVEELEYRYAITCIEDLIDDRWHTFGLPSAPSTGNENREALLKESLLKCAKHIYDGIEIEKKRLGVLDFADLEILTLKLLTENADIKKKYQGRIKHLLVDEYQDTSDLQSEIIRNLYKPGKNVLCIVGDPGQSIYGFRGANPEGIAYMQGEIEKGGGITVPLSENFRSAKPVLDFINGIFAGSGRFLPLSPGKEIAEPSKVAVLNVPTAELSSEEAREEEAAAIASYIGRLRNEENYDYRDVAILFRSFSDIELYERELMRNQIPYYRSGGRTFLNQTETGDILLSLRAVAFPEDDTIAYGLARSTIIGLSDEECFKLFDGRKRPIFEILSDHKNFGFLKQLVQAKEYLSISELIAETARLSGLYKIFESVSRTGQATANIEKLIGLASQLSSQYDYSLSDFLDYIDDLKMRGVGIDEPPLFTPHDNAVKLLTVHAAKGLEFNVVILADLARAPRPYSLPYIKDKKLGLGFKLKEGDNPIADREPTLSFKEINEAAKEEENLEKERLLYVAATRAKRTLVICDTLRKNPKNTWLEILKPHTETVERLTMPADKKEMKTSIQEPILVKKAVLPKSEIHFTVSHLESYYRCPQEYYLKYAAKVPAEKIAPRAKKMQANDIGNVVHKVIQLGSGADVCKAEELILPACREYGYSNPLPENISEIGRHLTNYQKSEYNHLKLKKPRHETPFVFKSGLSIIRGTIDCIYEKDGGYAIVDFKTDAVKDNNQIEEKITEYRLQILTYAIAARRALNKNILSVALLFLDNGEAREIALHERDFQEGLDMINNISKMIQKNAFEIDVEKTPCHKCPYHHNKICWLDKYSGR